jgi:hypothetical protein
MQSAGILYQPAHTAAHHNLVLCERQVASRLLVLARSHDKQRDMSQLFQIIGFTWALIGVSNLVMVFMQGVSARIATAGVLINVLLFVLPGLAVVVLGSALRTRAKTKPRANGTRVPSQERAGLAASVQ